jgi:hypothetical protein
MRRVALVVATLGLSLTTACLVGVPDLAESGDAGGETGSGASFSCADSGAVLCEDFEAPLRATVWNGVLAPGASLVERDPTRHHSGAYSLHVQLDGAYVGAALNHEAPAPPTLPLNMYIRVYAWASPPAPPGPEALVSLASADGQSGLILAREADMSLGMTDYSPGPTYNWGSSATLPSTPEWVCLEWHVDTTNITADTGNIGVTLAANVVQPLTQMSVPVPTFDQLTFGISYEAPIGATSDVWFDDIVVDGAPIGCPE